MTPKQIAQTAASIASMQESDGAIPWTIGEHTDAWNHVEGAMALLVGGETEAAEAAYDWCLRNQRVDGSWPMKLVAGAVEDASTETNMAAYIAVGVLHHWSIRQDREFLERMWPVVRRALDLVADLQLPFGGIAWSREWDANGPAKINAEALLAGSSSIYQALRCGVALAELMDEPQPHWELAGGRLGHALRKHRDQFLDKSTFSMDWYYPVLGGAVRGAAAEEMLASRWDTFVEDGLGIRCVSANPWVTGAETCELAMALSAIGDPRAEKMFADMQHLRSDDGAYWTGYVFPDDVNWPVEHTTYTAAAVILAWDVLNEVTPGAGVMTGHGIGVEFGEIALECDCPSSDRFAGVSPGAR
jgi:hypothetical protein